VGISDEALNDVTLTGWFLLKGERSNDYLFFSVRDSSTNIFILFYNTALMSFSYDLLVPSLPQLLSYNYLAKNNWYFIKAKLTFDGSMTPSLKLYLQIY